MCIPVVTGVTPKPYYYHSWMWRHIGRSYDKYAVTPLVVGPRRSPRDIRNAAGEAAIAGEATHLFFLDDDILPPPNIVDLLLDADKPIIGCYINRDDGLPIIFKKNGERWLDCPDEGVFECGRVGLGCMMIKTEVLKQLWYPWFFFKRDTNTMDSNFCDLAADSGISTWCNADARCGQIVHEEQEV